ncbi:ABC transporter ATP-binding protein [Mycolicibacterium fluoranthenivorans]|uniref:ABC-type quaternary amine transporter n=1 Tax=Mycolicibacterium fluoranthenivorans TaxID=258505 RepID=A0A1G4WX02_9MYCO|nr:ABC transporter ATP-binding protein [Mycolicibacterium fluoranthenivorans]QNJ94817.1 ABC transporter ATP-binding protein [Mycolicibacterium fluoranthenivorans]SCX31419.1 spermidine/putrescine transport system ATP-binding protein [Mycolicibacterium fluoranthenivorans]
MTKEACALRLSKVHRRFGDYVAVEELDLSIADGEFFSLIGPSGCGKTTTLRMIAGLDQPTSGTIEVAGLDVTRTPPHRRPVNTVFQHYALFPHLDVQENVAFGLRERRMSNAEIRPRVDNILELVGLQQRKNHKPRLLSGGQQQRVALARALVLEPQVLVLDEPLGALDLKLRKSMQALLRQVQREVGITFIYVTHDQEEAFSMSTRVGVMNGGILEQVGPPRDVYQRPETLFVADFVGASNHIPVTVTAGPDGNYLAQFGNHQVISEGPANLANNSSAALVVRPEGITLTAPSAGVLQGTVTDTSYSGPQEELTVETPVGKIKAVARGALDCKIGDNVGMTWEATSSWLVAGSVKSGPAESTASDEGDRAADLVDGSVASPT